MRPMTDAERRKVCEVMTNQTDTVLVMRTATYVFDVLPTGDALQTKINPEGEVVWTRKLRDLTN